MRLTSVFCLLFYISEMSGPFTSASDGDTSPKPVPLSGDPHFRLLLENNRVSSDHAGLIATFAASNGNVIELDTRTGTLVTPRSRGTRLEDCSDKVQVCLTDHHGFAFAYFRKCKDAGSGNYKRLRFRPKIVSVLHGNLWMVFDAAPNYMFHYIDSKGIVGIYLGPTASFDFRSVLHDRNFKVFSLDATEYRITSSETVAACGE